MKIYCVNVDVRKGYCSAPGELCDYDLGYLSEDYEWLTYAYYVDTYEGGGEAVAYKDGKLYIYNLGHCSCYGPLEGSPDVMTVEEWLNNNNVLNPDIHYGEVKDKVCELLGLSR
jgi:hypothetical protein